MRMGSRRLPRKNIRAFFGKPIFVHTLEAAKRCGLFDETIVSTESEEIRNICREYGLELPFMRPAELAKDSVQLAQVVEHVLEVYGKQKKQFENFCLLWATAPMRTADDICAAYELLSGDTEAVVGITDYDLPVFCALHEGDDGFMNPLFEAYHKLPSSKQPRAVVDNSSMCWVRVSAFQEHGTWLPPKLKGYWMPRYRSVDIDTEDDWQLAEYYYRKYFLATEM